MIELCHDLVVPCRLVDRHPEFDRFLQTLCFAGQFIEPVAFDRVSDPLDRLRRRPCLNKRKIDV
jgi:hypothetical protein